MPRMKLQSSEGEVFDVDVAAANVSGTLKTMLDLLGVSDEEEVVPLPKIKSKILKKVIEWATHHKVEEEKEEEEEGGEWVEEEDGEGLEDVEVITVMGDEEEDDSQPFYFPDWETEFLKVDPMTLCELVEVAEYLDIPGLKEAASKACANLIKGKTTEEIRAIFSVQNDFSASEEAMVHMENAWCDGI